MGTIGIVMNPNSGKDVRRLVSHATGFNNNEKINIVLRIILALKAFGKHRVYLMPDGYYLSTKVLEILKSQQKNDNVEIINMAVNENHTDTTEFVRQMGIKGCDVVVVLGGDGTSRAAAKVAQDIPIISVSTGTNNVFPDVLEGTVVGIAAAAIAQGIVTTSNAANRCKKINIYKNGEYIDLALIDAVISGRTYVGSKAIWDLDDMEQIIVTQCHPGTIGFSALVGAYEIVKPEDDCGYILELGNDNSYKGAIAAGIIQDFSIKNGRKLNNQQLYTFRAQKNGVVAVDGEREIPFKKDDLLGFKIDRTGPYKVDVYKTISLAQKKGFFQK